MRWTALVLMSILPGCGDATAPAGPDGDGSLDVALETVATGLTAPVLVTAPAGDPRIFIVQQDGRILIHENGTLRPQPFLDLTAEVNYAGESGLLGLAFHPRYAQNGYVYVDYTDNDLVTHVVRYRVSTDPARADAASATPILTVRQPFPNHNGGHLEFDADGMLLVGLGDGGSAGDPNGNGQNRGTLLGSILRLDVDGGTPYAIPADNPFRDTPAARAEIWAYGLRNPWRFAVDAAGGRLYIADVGQSRIEEINAVALDGAGLNYGWNITEGTSCYAAATCSRDGITLPVLEYSHDEGCSVTGGRVYRGSAIPGLVGHYVYADYCAGWIRSFLMTDTGPTLEREWAVGDLAFVTSFGSDAAGELYVTVVRSGGAGEVLRVIPGG